MYLCTFILQFVAGADISFIAVLLIDATHDACTKEGN
jgi:hypothetical protein